MNSLLPVHFIAYGILRMGRPDFVHDYKPLPPKYALPNWLFVKEESFIALPTTSVSQHNISVNSSTHQLQLLSCALIFTAAAGLCPYSHSV
jgi:hypothetical protein